MTKSKALAAAWTLLCAAEAASALAEASQAEVWRREHRVIDLHQHINFTPDHLARAVRIMDGAGIGIGVNLSGGYATTNAQGVIPFQESKEISDRLFPGRFLLYMNLDYTRWDEPTFAEEAIQQVERGHALGAAGLKEFKRLGLYLRNKAGALLRVDDPKLEGVWKRCGELGMPISIHVADPVAFWLPYEASNERWEELRDHPNWWFGDPTKFPPHRELLDALNRVIARNPKTTFVCVHFANNPEDLDWVERSLDRNPNMMADIAARVPEIGRKDPERVRNLFLKHQDRILFATDFMVYDKLILGSGGSGPAPTDSDANDFFAKHWRWFETTDRNFPHMTPIQGNWNISGIGLPPEALRKIYFDNAAKLLARSLPKPVLRASKREPEFSMSTLLKPETWKDAPATRMEYGSLTAQAHPGAATRVQALHSTTHLALRYSGSIQDLTVFDPARLDSERVGLWDRDVVELFLAPDASKPTYYYEFEVAPTGEKLDLVIDPATPDIGARLAWNSGFEASSQVDESARTWTVVMRIPWKPMGIEPKPGTRLPMNLYRIDKSQNAYLAWNPTLRRTFHTPDRFGWLELGE